MAEIPIFLGHVLPWQEADGLQKVILVKAHLETV
jgi:hypothetical protein